MDIFQRGFINWPENEVLHGRMVEILNTDTYANPENTCVIASMIDGLADGQKAFIIPESMIVNGQSQID